MMVVNGKNSELLGIGIYTPGQAARLARVKTSLIARWVHGNAAGSAALRPQLENDPDRLVTFLDLVQTMAIRSIRLAKKIPLEKIREFIRVAEQEFDVSYPFARKHQTYLFDNEIVLRLADGKLVEVTGKNKKQDLIRQVAEVFMDDLAFASTGLAMRYEPFEYRGRKIVIDPEVRFGQPLVNSCGLSVTALLDAVRAEGSANAAAEIHGVELEDIAIAQRYDDWLRGVAA